MCNFVKVDTFLRGILYFFFKQHKHMEFNVDHYCCKVSDKIQVHGRKSRISLRGKSTGEVRRSSKISPPFLCIDKSIMLHRGYPAS